MSSNAICTRSLVVWTCTPRYRFAFVDLNTILFRNGSILSRPVLILFYLRNLSTLTCRIGIAHTARQQSCPLYSSTALGYDSDHYCLFRNLTQFSQIGIWPYLPFFSDLIAQDPHIGILVIEVLPISMHMTSPPLDRDAYCRAVTRILASLQISRITLVSHSYGTVLTTHMLHDPFLSSLISSMLFIDPIPFLLHFPNVAFNFVYREPRLGNEWLMWYFASRDADISRALSRHFFWAENVLWKEELEGRKVAVVLSGADQIVNAKEVGKYLTGEQELSRRWEMGGLEVLFYPGLDHGMVFDTKERRKPMLDIIGRFVRLE
jgi:Alpha/beta hydrolase family